MKKTPAVLLTVILLAAWGAGVGASEPAAEFTLADTGGHNVSLKSYRNKQAVLLFFWTTWCPYCRQQLGIINDKYAQISAKGLAVLGIDVGESPQAVRRFLEKYSLQYPVLLDSKAEVIAKYHAVGVPTYVLVDKKGNAVYEDNYFPSEDKIAEALGPAEPVAKTR